MTIAALPKVLVIGCGGTISSLGASSLDLMDYPDGGQKLAVQEVVDRVPELKGIADIIALPFRAVSSSAITTADWVALRDLVQDRCRSQADLAGVVILHGTGTLEETAFFLHLTADVDQPVIVTGAQRPLSAISSDGPLNLVNAVKVAADSTARGRGVLVVMNEEIHSARDVVKTSNYRVQAFRSPDFGMLGQVDGDGVRFFRTLDRRHTRTSPFAKMDLTAALPRVDILYAHAGVDDVLVEAALAAGARGLVSAGLAPGLVTPPVKLAFERLAAEGFPIVLCSRAAAGRVTDRQYVRERQMIAGEDFSPQKARIVLMLALLQGLDVSVLRRIFTEI